MSNQRSEGWSRREFLTKVALAGTAGYLGLERSSLAAEPPPETTRIRLIRPREFAQLLSTLLSSYYPTRVSKIFSTCQ